MYINLIKVLAGFFWIFGAIGQMVLALYLHRILHLSYRPSSKVTNSFIILCIYSSESYVSSYDIKDTTHAENARHMLVLYWCKDTGCSGKADVGKQMMKMQKKTCYIVPALLIILPWEITTYADPDSIMTKLKSS